MISGLQTNQTHSKFQRFKIAFSNIHPNLCISTLL